MTSTLTPERRKHIIIGTAGHVDHGKTTLVKALTGVDTDRLPEEKERAMTIDLGFARFELPGGQQAAIVDVPGHERFIGNMLAGATGIDLVLRGIAADEGVMPQTREHLDILDLLGLTTGIVVLTKSDLVDQELLDVVALEVREALAGTFLEDAPVRAETARTGQGLAQLLAACSAAVQGACGKPASGPARLPVDRAFTAPGFGTIVTGTLVSGAIAVDDRLELLPVGREVRVRGLEVHGERREQVSAGERVATNLAGVARDEVWRGMVIAASGAFQSTTHFDAELRLLPRVPRPLRSGQRLHLHTGTSEVLVRIVLLEQASLAPGSTGLVQLHAESPLVLGPRDRFIVRQYSPVETLGGGVVLDASPQWRRRRPRGQRSEALRHRLLALRRGSPDEVALSLIAGMEDGFAVPAKQAVEDRLRSELSLDAAGVTALLFALTASARLIALPGGGYTMSAARWQRAAGAASDFLAAYHVRWPLRLGATREELRAGALGSPPPRVFAAQLEMLIREQVIAQRHDRLAMPDFAPQLHGAHLREADRIRKALAVAGASPPSRGELAPDQEVLDYLARSGEAVRLTDDLYYGHAQLQEISRLLQRHLQECGAVTVSDFRQLIGTTRKYAVPLLEYFDQQRITQRQGDVRVAGALATQPKQSSEVK